MEQLASRSSGSSIRFYPILSYFLMLINLSMRAQLKLDKNIRKGKLLWVWKEGGCYRFIKRGRSHKSYRTFVEAKPSEGNGRFRHYQEKPRWQGFQNISLILLIVSFSKKLKNKQGDLPDSSLTNREELVEEIKTVATLGQVIILLRSLKYY